MLDTISMDCAQLASPDLARLWSFLLEHLDLLAVTSELTGEQIERRLPVGREILRLRSLHSLDLADYRMTVDDSVEAPAPPGFVFVVGNHFWHKEVATTVNALAEADPRRTVVFLGGPNDQPPESDDGRYAPRGLRPRPNVLRLSAGALSHAEIGAVYRDAAVVVFPSHYEGFGIPLLNALAARKPVVIRPLPVFEEMIRQVGEDPNIHVFQTTHDLVQLLSQPIAWRDQGAAAGLPGDARRAAQEVGEALDRMIARAQHGQYDRIARRIRSLLTLHDYSALHPAQPMGGDSRAYIAASVGGAVERLARQMLGIPGVLAASRGGYRVIRRLTGRAAS
jgi:glycosyltransferase involved in cell wall biosynthesis